MPALTASDLLTVWEETHARHPIERALRLLQASYPTVPVETLSALSLGRRDALLLALREQVFGGKMSGVATCPTCGEQLELELQVDDLIPLPADESPDLRLNAEGYEVWFRLLNSTDLMRLAESVRPDGAQLLESSVVAADYQGASVDPDDLPETVRQALAEALDEADPGALLLIDLQCPACDHRWENLFDIVTFLWSEIDTWARHLLREVHVLARAYGWREADILNMSALRRNSYLEMVSE